MWFFIKKISAFRWQLLAGLLLALLLAVASIALLSLSGWFISSAAFAGLSAALAMNYNYFIPAGTIRFLALLRIISRYGDRVVNHDFTFKILTELRLWFYQQLLPLAPAKLLVFRSGDMLNRFIHDIDTLDNLYLRVLSPVVISLIIAVGVTIFIGYFSIKIALSVAVLILIALTLLPIVIYTASKKIGRCYQESIATLRIKSIDFIQGFITRLLFIPAQYQLDDITQAQEEVFKAEYKLAKLKGFATGIMALLSGVSIWLVVILGIPMVNEQALNGALWAMIILCLIITYEQLLSLPLALLSLGKTQQAARRLLSVANTKPAVVFANKKITLLNQNNISIHFDNVTFQYQNRTEPAIRHFSTSIKAGSKAAIVGPSGSGKTTLMHLLTRVWDPSSGVIYLNDQPLQALTENQLRQMIAVVPQQVYIFNASVKDNLTLMRNDVSHSKLMHTLRLVELDGMIETLPNGLNTAMGDFGKQFSGGQIRRIGIVRALLTNAPIHIWDEPTTGLNVDLVKRIWKNCESLLQDKTHIIITHNEALTRNHQQIQLTQP